jgi:two-component system NarL family sensor kinase
MQNEESFGILIILACLAMFSLIVIIILFVVTYQRKMLLKEKQINLIEQEKQVQLFKAIVDTEEKQKEKIARNLHDEINPLLNVLKYNLTKYRIRARKNTFDPESLITDEETIIKVMEGIRTTCLDLIPSFLFQNGLVPSLEEYINNIRKIGELYAEFESDTAPEKVEQFNTQELLNIYRICLEILNNIFKHSRCTFFKMIVKTSESALTVNCIHDGKGVTNEEIENYTNNALGLGLKSLKARSLLLNAKINYSKNINSSSVELIIPLKQ